MLELFPEGFAEERVGDSARLIAFTDEAGAERLRASFENVQVDQVAPGWADEWRQFHRPVEVAGLWIGPPWEAPDRSLLSVVIDPGQAFGTGAHPTTQLCVDALAGLEPASVVDVGCGSGVVAIAAARLGFAPVIALDSDEAAVEAARRNARANEVEVEVVHLDATRTPLPGAEIVVANIDLETLARVAWPSSARVLVTSGYYESERPDIEGFRPAERVTRDGWAADVFRRE